MVMSKNKINKVLAGGIVAILLCFVPASCDKYLDIVPNDGIATVEMAFRMRSQAIKYLASCYSYLGSVTPGQMDYVAYAGSDEFYVPVDFSTGNEFQPKNSPILLGFQNVTSPYNNDFAAMYQAFRYCNTFVEEINKVPDMDQWEKDMWAAEAKVLKAYYMFYAIRKWGPIPIVKKNLEISASIEESRVYRDNIDDCFDYAIALIDEASPFLFEEEISKDDLGRITKPIAAMLKAKIAVTAASPLFNNNADQASLVSNGKQLFPTKTAEKQKARWTAALKACEDAIVLCHKVGKELYYFSGNFSGDYHIYQELSIREAIGEDWNSECVWGNTQNYSANQFFQRWSALNNNVEKFQDVTKIRGHENFGVSMRVAELFYTKNGLPIGNDIEWKNVDISALRTASNIDDEKWYIQQGYTTAEFNFDREPRYYADIAFDGGYTINGISNSMTPSNLGKILRGYNVSRFTGFSCKKLSKYSLVCSSSTSYSLPNYIYPTFRLADLYLLYAEAINEAEGPSGEHSGDMFKYLDLIRSRAGIPGVKESWDSYSDSPGKYSTQMGMREIIHRERQIELAFEGERFWDLRRWKEAQLEMSKGITGWNVGKAGSRELYYKPTLIFETSFSQKDYFWPFSTAILENNSNLVQNIGW